MILLKLLPVFAFVVFIVLWWRRPTVKRFTRVFGKSPQEINQEEITRQLVNLFEEVVISWYTSDKVNAEGGYIGKTEIRIALGKFKRARRLAQGFGFNAPPIEEWMDQLNEE